MATFADPAAAKFWNPYRTLNKSPYNLRRETVTEVFFSTLMGLEEQRARSGLLDLCERLGWDITHLYYVPFHALNEDQVRCFRNQVANGDRDGSYSLLLQIYGRESSQRIQACAVYWTWTAFSRANSDDAMHYWRRAVCLWSLLSKTSFLQDVATEPHYRTYLHGNPTDDLIFQALARLIDEATSNEDAYSPWKLVFRAVRKGIDLLFDQELLQFDDVASSLIEGSFDGLLSSLEVTAEDDILAADALHYLSALGPARLLLDEGDPARAVEYVITSAGSVSKKLDLSISLLINLGEEDYPHRLVSGATVPRVGFKSDHKRIMSSRAVTRYLNEYLATELPQNDLVQMKRRLNDFRNRYGTVVLDDVTAERIIQAWNTRSPSLQVGNELRSRHADRMDRLNECIQEINRCTAASTLPSEHVLLRARGEIVSCRGLTDTFINELQAAVLSLDSEQQTWHELSYWHKRLNPLLDMAEKIHEYQDNLRDELTSLRKTKTWLGEQEKILSSLQPDTDPYAPRDTGSEEMLRLKESVLALVRAGKKIQAIKLLHDRTNLGLKKAKDLVESLFQGEAEIRSASHAWKAGFPREKASSDTAKSVTEDQSVEDVIKEAAHRAGSMVGSPVLNLPDLTIYTHAPSRNKGKRWWQLWK